ncbi:MAG TPA: two-component regulator propeller domain-containing protein, partial [Chitinophagaceae bacterium]|nr:two-component regulator propeller domain-containing protein [Chitinophagaceae bacterium]
VTAEIPGIYGVHAAPDGRIWVNTEQKLLSLDTTELRKGKLVLQELPGQFAQLRSKRRHFVLFDKGNNCWLGDQNSVLIRAGPDGTMTTFTSVSGLNMFSINFILQDSEGTTWIATQNAGVSKLVHSNFSHLEKPFDIIHPSDISYNENKNHLLIYSSSTSAATVVNDREKKYLDINNLNNITSLVETPSGFLATRLNGIYKLIQKKNALYAETRPILSDAPDNVYSGSAIDHNGNFIVCGKYHVSAIVKGEIIFRKKLPFFADFPVVDARGNIWVATRSNDLFMYQTHPDQPANYLEQKKHFKNELSGISPRSITIDKNNNIWIGTRNNGIQVFYVSDGNLIRKFSLTAATGLSDDFITYLTCDPENNIWACSGLGLDKIRIKNEIPVIENITKQNHIYQSVFKVAVDKNNTVWGLVSNGLIRITPEERQVYDYRPTLTVSLVKAGKDTIRNDNSFSHKQNNLSFYFSATSFLDEKQILYSYRLQGGSNDQWSEPSNNSTVSFIDLPPGNYTLDIKAGFPAGRYPEQIISYKFLISPAWWQTWWFRLVNALVLIALLIITFRYYYRRKLEKQKIFLEKQQAIEKERTRIATDMHDDLGAGLSRIKFLSQSLLNKKKDEIMKPELEKITSFSDEMSEKMGEIIWALNEKNDTLADLIAYTRSYAAEYLASHDIQCQANTPMNLPGTFITGEMRRNIFLSVKECLHNVVKHAGATKVCFSRDLNHHMQIIIHDNGKGIDPDSQRLFSNGIQNIEKRMKEIK